jgi:hypothetical protein
MSSAANPLDLERGPEDGELWSRVVLKIKKEGPSQARHGEYIEDGAYLVSMGV